MSTNCIRCVVNKRTGPDLICDDCRFANTRSPAMPNETPAREMTEERGAMPPESIELLRSVVREWFELRNRNEGKPEDTWDQEDLHRLGWFELVIPPGTKRALATIDALRAQLVATRPQTDDANQFRECWYMSVAFKSAEKMRTFTAAMPQPIQSFGQGGPSYYYAAIFAPADAPAVRKLLRKLGIRITAKV